MFPSHDQGGILSDSLSYLVPLEGVKVKLYYGINSLNRGKTVRPAKTLNPDTFKQLARAAKFHGARNLCMWLVALQVKGHVIPDWHIYYNYLKRRGEFDGSDSNLCEKYGDESMPRFKIRYPENIRIGYNDETFWY